MQLISTSLLSGVGPCRPGRPKDDWETRYPGSRSPPNCPACRGPAKSRRFRRRPTQSQSVPRRPKTLWGTSASLKTETASGIVGSCFDPGGCAAGAHKCLEDDPDSASHRKVPPSDGANLAGMPSRLEVWRVTGGQNVRDLLTWLSSISYSGR
jgi:hypothetical protein